LMEAKDKADITISIDSAGQDDIQAMDAMVQAWYEGNEVVYGVRSNRDTDTLFKRATAELCYKLLNQMGVETVFNHADYRLITARVLKEFSNFEEVNLFLRGLIPLVGFSSTSVFYDRHERIAGESHYPLKKMLALAFEGITSLSVQPIHFITATGLLFMIIGSVGLIIFLCLYLNGKSIGSMAGLMFLVCLISGIQILAIGIVGEYVGKTYLESKHRPRFIISERTRDSK